MDKRDEEDKKWRNKREEIKERMNIPVASLVEILVIIDNCTRKCLGLPVFVNGKNVTADDVIKALKDMSPPELMHIISYNGQQFVAHIEYCHGRIVSGSLQLYTTVNNYLICELYQQEFRTKCLKG